MPSGSNYFNFICVNLGFIVQIVVMMYFKSAVDIKENWPLYRCNPSYWIFSDNISNDFSYCVQNTQVNTMGYILQPLNYMVSSLTSVSGSLSDSLNDVRGVLSNTRDFVSSLIENVFSVFLNMMVEFQKIMISIKDMVGKMIGIVVTIMYVLDGSVKTMNSAWSGPPGQLVKSIGSCFHPDTPIVLKNGEQVAMKNAPLGAELEGGGAVFAVLQIHNAKQEPLYVIDGNGNQNVLVTGEHFVYDRATKEWMQVKDYSKARLTEVVVPQFSCLITTNRRIKVGTELFWDWEDDECLGKTV